MAAQNITDAFEECVSRMASGQTIEQCLLAYPQYADQLRPMLQTSQAVQGLRIPQSQLHADQAIVWQKMLSQNLNSKIVPIQRRRPPYQLLIALVMLFLTMAVTWFMLTRPELPVEEEDAIIATLTVVTLLPDPSQTPTVTLTLSPTLPSPSPTPTVTPTISPSSTQESVLTTTQTSIPSATFAPGCGVPLTEEDATTLVQSIYPNTTITSIRQMVKYGETLVWEVQTSHNTLLDIDVACGTILLIESTGDDTAADDNGSQSGGNNASSGGSGGGNGSSDDDDDDDDDSDDDNSDDYDSDDDDDDSDDDDD